MSKDSQIESLNSEGWIELNNLENALREQLAGISRKKKAYARSLPEEIQLLDLMGHYQVNDRYFYYEEIHELSETGDDVRITRMLRFPELVNDEILGLSIVALPPSELNPPPSRTPIWGIRPWESLLRYPSVFGRQHEQVFHPKIAFNDCSYVYIPIPYIPPDLPRGVIGGFALPADREAKEARFRDSVRSNIINIREAYEKASKTCSVLRDEYYLAQNCLREVGPYEQFTTLTFHATIKYDKDTKNLVFRKGTRNAEEGDKLTLEEFNSNNMQKVRKKQNELRNLYAAKVAAAEAKVAAAKAKVAAAEAKALCDEDEARRGRDAARQEEERNNALKQEAEREAAVAKLNEVRHTLELNRENSASWWKKLFCPTREQSEKRKREGLFSK